MTEPDYFIPIRDICAPIKWTEVWATPKSEIHLELGAGDGGFAAAMAARYPGIGFLAVERLLGRARKIAKKAARASLGNLRVLRLESAYTIRYLVPAASLDVLHIMHPDPWPKKRHFKHRMFQKDFLADCHRALKPGGELRLTLDHPGYYAWILELLQDAPGWIQEAWRPAADYPLSEFQQQFFAEGKVVMRQIWRAAPLP